MNGKNKLKLVFVANGMMLGGAERILSTLINELILRGHEITLLSLKSEDSAYELNERVHFIKGKALPAKGLHKIVQFCRVFRTYKEVVYDVKPDIVFAFLSIACLVTIIGRMTFARKIPVIVSERADPTIRRGIISKLIRWLFPKADAIVCQGERVKTYYSQLNPYTRIEVIGNMINQACIADEKPLFRKPVIVAVGRLSNQKNYDLLIESFAKFNYAHPGYSVEIYGQGPEKERLQRKIDDLGLHEYIQLMGTKNNVMKHVYDCSVFVMSSNYEGFPNALVEAMASGIPSICTDYPTGTVHEIIQNGVNGMIVPVNDINAMVAALHMILGDPALQQKIGEEARKIRERLATEPIINKWERLSYEIAEKNHLNVNIYEA